MSAEHLLEELKRYGVDTDGAMERFLDDADLYQSCLQMFMSDDAFERLDQALRENDRKKAFDAAHSLKGVAANLGLDSLLQAISQIVEVLRRDTDDDLAALYANLQTELEKLKEIV